MNFRSWRPQFTFQGGPRISEEEKELLQREFEEQEAVESLRLCAADKVPGPDGFSIGFFHKYWEIVNEDVMDTIKNFHCNEYFEKSLMLPLSLSSPKKSGARELKDFRPLV